MRAPWQPHREATFSSNATRARSIGSAASSYTQFAFSYAHSADEAYAMEWRTFDEYGGVHELDNPSFPAAPAPHE